MELVFDIEANGFLFEADTIWCIVAIDEHDKVYSFGPDKINEGIKFLQTISNEKNCSIYTSLIISENEKKHNRGIFIHPNLEIDFYDKRKTFGLAGEDEVFSSGKNEVIVSFRGWRFNLQICYDLRFPEITANRIDKNGNPSFDVILYVANWPEKRASHWDALLKARAIENQSYVLACNRVGKDNNDITYIGGSCGLDAFGELITASTQEGVVAFQISKNSLDKLREQYPFLKDR